MSSQGALFEHRTIAPIPKEERHGRVRDLFTFWFASNLQPLTVITGALGPLAFGLSFGWTAFAIVVGNLVGGIFMALHSAQGPHLGVPQMIQSRGQFGRHGSVLVIVLVIVMYLGFLASGLVLSGQIIHIVASSLSVNAGIVISTILALTIACCGYNVLHLVNRYATPLFSAALVLATIWILGKGLPGSFLHKGGFQLAPFLAFLAIVATWQIAYAPYVSDYSRYLPEQVTVRDTFMATYGGSVLATMCAMLFGALAFIVSGAPDVLSGVNSLTDSVGWVIMVCFFLGITNASAIQVYGAVLCTITSAETVRPGWLPAAPARVTLGVLAAVVGAVMALAGQAHFVTSYENFVLLLLVFLIPWTAINLTDYYLLRRGNYDVRSFFRDDGGAYGRFAWLAIATYLVALAAELPFVNTAKYEGPLAKDLNGADLSWLIGLGVAGGLYYAGRRLAARRSTASVGAALEVEA